MSQAPQVTVKEFVQNHFFTSVEAETDVDNRELNVLQMKVCTAIMTCRINFVLHVSLLSLASRQEMRSFNPLTPAVHICRLLMNVYCDCFAFMLCHPQAAFFPHAQLRDFLDSFAGLAPAVKEANRAAAAAAAAASGAGQASAEAAVASAPATAPSAPGPSSAAPAADDSDEDDCLVTDTKTADELYEVCCS